MLLQKKNNSPDAAQGRCLPEIVMKTEREWIIQTAAAEYAAAALRTGSGGIFALTSRLSPPAHLQLHIYFILHLYFSHLLFLMAEQIRTPSNLSSLRSLRSLLARCHTLR